MSRTKSYEEILIEHLDEYYQHYEELKFRKKDGIKRSTYESYKDIAKREYDAQFGEKRKERFMYDAGKGRRKKDANRQNNIQNRPSMADDKK